MGYISVAIDGPAGAGKSSVAKAVASELSYIYIDTGAMYRAVALYLIENGIDTKDERKLEKIIDDINIQIKYVNGEQHIYLDNKDVSSKIRTPEVSRGASDVATIKIVREKLVKMQRELAELSNIIMDGRDIGTVVLPKASIKIFLTASVDARALRRFKELKEKGISCEYEKIKAEIIARDKNDSEREISPLKQADESILLDSSDMSFEEVKNTIKLMIKEHGDVL